MIRYHWLYRDFLAASSGAPGTWADRVWSQYVERHEAVLDRIYFDPKGWHDKAAVRERLIELGPARFRTLERRIQHPKAFEEAAASEWNAVMSRLRYTGPAYDVFVLVGLDSTNIYSLSVDGRPETVICIESVDGDPSGIQRLIAHESHHWARQHALARSLTSEIGERLVSEGLAAIFSEEVQPGRHISDYCYVPSDTVAWVTGHPGALAEVAALEGHSQPMDILFSRTYAGLPPIPNMPLRTGYVYGYLICREALRVRHPGVSAGDSAGIPWQEFLDKGAVLGHG